MDSTRTANGRRYTVDEADEILGISAEAVRARINRGTLPKEKDEDGTVYVRLDVVRTHTNDRTTVRTNGDATRDPTNGDATDDHTVSDSLAFQLMRDHIAFLQAELERKDHLLARALERIPPAIEAPPGERGSFVRAAEDAEDDTDGEGERRSWWRRFFDL